MKNWFVGILLVFLGLIACNKNDFDQNYGVNDLNFKDAVAIDEAGSAFAVGTHTFTELNLTRNRWGWANNLSEASSETPTPVKYNISGRYADRYMLTWYDITHVDAIEVWNDDNNLYIKTNVPNLEIGWIYAQIPNSRYTEPIYLYPNTIASIPFNTIPNYNGETTVYCWGSMWMSSIIVPYHERNPNYDCGYYFSYNITEPLPSTIELPLYMGAAKNDITKGTLVGKALVTYDGTTAKIKYVLDGYEMNGVHIYAKDTKPTTIAPGQYGFTQTFETPISEFETELNVPDVDEDGKFWLILHAVVNI